MMNLKSFLASKVRRLLLLLFDISCFALVSVGYFVANLLFEPYIPYKSINFFANAVVLLLFILVVRSAFGVYNSILRYTRTFNHFKLMIADVVGAMAATLFSWICKLYEGAWFFLIIASVNALITLFSRFVYRLLYKLKNNRSFDEKDRIHIAIIGAGQIGACLANELLSNPQSIYEPVFFVDKNPEKAGHTVAGLKIYAEDESVFQLIEKNDVEEIFIAISGIDNHSASQLFDFYSRTTCKLKIYDVPVTDFSVGQSGKLIRGNIRNFEIEDLLFRKTLSVTDSETVSYYSGKVVLITGGGGSIGSELCRQVAKCSPAHLIILDIYENNAYDIQQELLRTYGNKLKLSVEIASVRDRERLDCIFNHYKPQIVFHAAAHKHVPLMEHSGCEAIKNNIFGTYNTADMAEKHGAEKFILISTDKAVNPTNIMGASKRMCEMIVQSRTDSQTSFAAVRFGNVLGSNGSVIPLFKQQIAQGGPVTITDRRIIRYFMTIPEASQLVMEAGAMAKSGELFVLDMGKPIRIYDLALNMIRLSGLELNKDIEIREIGLRPGEKLYEELLIKTETLDKTENDLIFIEKDEPFDRIAIAKKMDELNEALEMSKDSIASPLIKEAVKRAVPTYVDPEEINRVAEKAREMAEANA
ncbi:MAG: polysaccharide biosynthesis protein [Clostridia bacterium]|nr:polysaccharide biosynthesis protein [Clostridia bacterium]